MKDGKIFVLVVDDESCIRDFLKEMIPLLFPEMEVVAASSVSEAKVKMALNIPDIIITDLNMPRESGWDLIKYIREEPENQSVRDIPILIMSGNMSLDAECHQQAQAGLDISRTFILKKPFDRRLLGKRLDEILLDMRKEEKIAV